ncbi:MAG: flagellar motor switch protein FliG [Spirochaetaceae bacterium]|jgi:flagellar motor switch protein FliG|nr:flagellar motor switch protein FliG [Spirochaetaceae bacterium]
MGEEPNGTPGFLKTGPESAPESKFRRAAKFFILIGSTEAANILSRLPPDQVEAVSREIALVRHVGAEEGRAVLEEFGPLLSASGGGPESAAGGIEAARRLLYAAFGPDKGEQFLTRAVPRAKPNPFDFLEDFSGPELALLFREESPQAAALVFSRLPPKLSAGALASITGEKRLEIVRRIAKQSPVPPEVLNQVAGALREKARHIGKTGELSFDGMEALAAILKSSGGDFGDRILTELETGDPELGKALKDRVYTLSDLLEAEDRPLQKKLAGMKDKDIILLLKARTGSGETAAFREKILANLSRARREEILEEESIVGAVPRKEVEAAAAEFLGWFRQSRETGSITMMDDDLIV